MTEKKENLLECIAYSHEFFKSPPDDWLEYTRDYNAGYQTEARRIGAIAIVWKHHETGEILFRVPVGSYDD